jgi:hypothetical protein
MQKPKNVTPISTGHAKSDPEGFTISVGSIPFRFRLGPNGRSTMIGPARLIDFPGADVRKRLAKSAQGSDESAPGVHLSNTLQPFFTPSPDYLAVISNPDAMQIRTRHVSLPGLGTKVAAHESRSEARRPCQNRAKTIQAATIEVSFERKADSPNIENMPRRGNLWVIDERQPVFSVRNRRNFRQVESKDLCRSSPP